MSSSEPGNDDDDPSYRRRIGFLALRRHLSCHTDAHPIFDASNLADSDGLAENYRSDIVQLPPAEILKVINAIQTVGPS